MKQVWSLIGVFVASEPSATEYCCNLSPPLQGRRFHCLPTFIRGHQPWPPGRRLPLNFFWVAG